MVKVNTHNTEPDSTGGNSITKSGNYHFLVEKVEDFSQSDDPKLEAHMIVLAGDHADQVGKKIRETFWLAGDDEKKTALAHGKLADFACAIGLYSKAQWRADKEANVQPDLPVETMAEGRQFCAPIQMKPYTGNNPEKKKKNEGRVFANFVFKFWAVGDPESDAVAKCPDYLSVFSSMGGALPTREGPPRIPGTKPAGSTNAGSTTANASAPASRQTSLPAAPASVTHAPTSAAAPAAGGWGNF